MKGWIAIDPSPFGTGHDGKGGGEGQQPTSLLQAAPVAHAHLLLALGALE